MLLTNPIWLFALAAISIPVIIHLWNIKPGKTLKVGSISLFSESSPASSRSFKLQDILLLLLRCLLLILLAVLLTAPLWQQHLKTGKAKGWLLIPYADLNQTYRKFQPKIDSLTNAGYEFHFFRQDFMKQDLDKLTKGKLVTDGIKDKDTLNYWSLINQLSGKVSPAIPVKLFTQNTITYFTGDKPQTSLHINWHTYTPTDSVATWLAGAWLKVDGSIRVMEGTSTPSGTTYQYNNIKNGGQSGSLYSVTVENGLPFVNFNNTKLRVDTAIERIAVYTDKTEIDANYLKAALQAIVQLTQRNTIIKVYNNADDIPGGQNWVYWLSEKLVSDIILSKTKNIFNYEAGKITAVNSWINNSGSAAISQGGTKISLYKMVTAKTPAGYPVWTDGFGNPILSTEQKGKTVIYHFYTRFNPAWNELVWNDEFPKWLLTLTQPALVEIATHERRALNDVQIKPNFITDADKIPGQQTQYTDITSYVWLALALVLFAERWLATKNKTVLADG